MKKVLFMVAALACCTAMQAQIVSSRSSIRSSIGGTEKDLTWFFKAGVSFMNFGGDGAEGSDMKVGYNGVFGFQKLIQNNGAYWGMDLGLGSRGYNLYSLHVMAYNVQYSPFTFGWKIRLADKVKLDPHVAVYASYDFKSNRDWQNDYDICINIVVGGWDGRFNLDLTYQRGFVNAVTGYGPFKTSNVLLRLGVAF
ncbi:MAG: PorT family protein [Prevotellaceae bacterium]|nr:PorT family protein [Prevotellaceae bacterium]